jgi:hypothetical protein
VRAVILDIKYLNLKLLLVKEILKMTIQVKPYVYICRHKSTERYYIDMSSAIMDLDTYYRNVTFYKYEQYLI